MSNAGLSREADDMERVRPWRCGEQWQHPIPRPKDSDHWEKCHELVQKHDDEMCEAWKDEVDKLLIFAGLFSATVTAFTSESYKWLQEGSDDVTARLLAQISLQLSHALPNATTLPVVREDGFTFSVPASVVRINIFWFLSLTLSIGTVLIGILCTQWLREFQRDAARSHKDAVPLRQMRYEGLQEWHVPQILSALPLLLQSALILFFAGILDLLWTSNRVVAAVITIAVGALLLFLIITTVLPAVQSFSVSDPHLRVPQCPYKSPQSWAFYRLTLRVVLLLRSFLVRSITPDVVASDTAIESFDSFGGFFEEVISANWVDYDIRWRSFRDASFFDEVTGWPCEPQDSEDTVRALTWINKAFIQNIDTVYSVYHCLLELGAIASADVVAALDPAVDYLPSLLFPEDRGIIGPRQANDIPAAPDAQRREHILTVFLRLHKHIHPSLNVFYLESVIRLVNTSDTCVPDIAFRESDNDLQDVPHDILLQLFKFLKTVVNKDLVTIQHASQIWGFMRDLFIQERPMTDHLLALTFDIFEEFHHWLTYSEDAQVRRVETCVTGIIWIFSLLDAKAVSDLRMMEYFYKAEHLVQALDEYIRVHHSSESAILRGLGKRRWPQLRMKVLPDWTVDATAEETRETSATSLNTIIPNGS